MPYRQEPITVLVLPELNLKPFFNLVEKLAEDCGRHGSALKVLTCSGGLNHCTIKNSNRNDSALKTCAKCIIRRRLNFWRSNAKVDTFRFRSRVDINHLIPTTTNTADWKALTYQKIPVGSLCFFDLAIKLKFADDQPHLRKHEIATFKQILSDVIAIIDTLEKLADQVPISNLVSVDEYSVALAARCWARSKGINTTEMNFAYHFNAQTNLIHMHGKNTFMQNRQLNTIEHKEKLQSPLPAPIINEIAQDLKFRMTSSGGHIFSKVVNSHNSSCEMWKGLSLDKKTVVFYTSSPDEMMALNEINEALGANLISPRLYTSQIQLLVDLVSWSQEHDCQLIVKVHPRLADNHRDKGVSAELKHFNQLEQCGHPNVWFSMPNDERSAYDCLHFADACVVSWSTIALEVLKLGVPTIAAMTQGYSEIPSSSHARTPQTKEQFFDDLQKITTDESSDIEIIRAAYRWHYMILLANCVYIGNDNINQGNQLTETFSNLFEQDLYSSMKQKQTVVRNYRLHTNYYGRKSSPNPLRQEDQAIADSIMFFTKFFEEYGWNSSNSKLLARFENLLV